MAARVGGGGGGWLNSAWPAGDCLCQCLTQLFRKKSPHPWDHPFCFTRTKVYVQVWVRSADRKLVGAATSATLKWMIPFFCV